MFTSITDEVEDGIAAESGEAFMHCAKQKNGLGVTAGSFTRAAFIKSPQPAPPKHARFENSPD